jgi:dCMP deaminase
MPSDEYYMGLAAAAGAASKDRSVKIGCVFVGPDGEIRSTGYNGFPRGVNDGVEGRHQRPEKYLWTEHAERNAIYNATRAGVALKGCRVFVPWFPCMDCARALVQVGAVELIAVKPDLDDPKWGEDFRRVLVLLEEAGVALRYFDGPAAERGP